MGEYAHKGQILPIQNQMIPISKETTFHASFDKHLDGFNQGQRMTPIGTQRATYFNGNDFIEVENPLRHQSNINQEWTVMAWMKVEGASSTSGQNLLSGWNMGLRTSYSGRILMYINSGNHDYYKYGVVGLRDSKWHHVAFVFRNLDGLKDVYVDGVEVSNADGPNKTSTPRGIDDVVKIGDGLKGHIAELKIWDKAFSREGIIRNMQNNTPSDRKHLMGWWPMTEMEGAVTRDASGHGNDGYANAELRVDTGRYTASIGPGRFGNAVHLETATTNLFSNGELSNGANGWSVSSSATVVNRPGFTEITSTDRYGGINQSINITSGNTYIISYYVQWVSGANAVGGHISNGNNIKIRINGGPWVGGTSTEFPKTQEWHFVEEIFTANSSGSAPQYVQPGRGETETTTLRYRTGNGYGIQMEQGEYSTRFTENTRPEDYIEYSINVMNHTEGTIGFLGRLPYVLPAEHNDMHISTTGGLYSASMSLNMQSSSAYPYRILGVHWSDAAGTSNHTEISTTSVKHYNNGGWNHFTITWHKDNGWRLYLNGNIEASSGRNVPLRPFDADTLHFKRFQMEELRIESRQISDEEVKAWANASKHYNYLDYSLDAE